MDTGRNYRSPTLRTLFPETFHHHRHREYFQQIQTALSTNKRQFDDMLIRNLSDYPLTEHERSIICKGLRFVPTPTNNHHGETNYAILQLDRRIRNAIYFGDADTGYTPNAYHTTSTWQPPSIQDVTLHTHVNNLYTHMRQHIARTPQDEDGDNITHYERAALQELASRRDITMKKTDKGGGITILNTTDYLQQIRTEHLSQTSTYQPIDHSPTQAIARDTHTLIQFLLCRHRITEQMATFMEPSSPSRTPLLYGMPKLHKTGHPLRPIVSGISSPTDNMAKFMTLHLSPLIPTIPTIIRDSIDFKIFLRTIPALPLHAYLVTADVTSLYTNIPQEEGIDANCRYIDEHRDILRPDAPTTHVLRLLMHHILHHNFFAFLDSFFLQISGTAMGCRMAPHYANLFMHFIDQQILSTRPGDIQHFKRFIDDIFFIYYGEADSILLLQDWFNKLHPTIKFKLHCSRTQVSFLDMIVYVDQDRQLRTDLYRKPTDTYSLLHFTSNHPSHTFQSIIYSQALRMNMLTDDDDKLRCNLHNLTRALLAKDYPLRLINQQINKAMSKTQDTLLQNTRTVRAPPSLILTIPFSTSTRSLQHCITDFWNTHMDMQLPVRLQAAPRVTFKRHKNLTDILIHTNTTYNDTSLP